MDKSHTIICKYEDITLKDIQRCLELGFTTVEDIKRLTRVGMGPCQGRDCIHLVIEEIHKFTGKPKSEIKGIKQRPNLSTIPLNALAKGDYNE
ncbi:(2Fe-2S)-binding protein [Acholeplasma equirhinis]|uniref:(2Fe-2S)-binding protein n=1 Tax=Acholeplasma equirhinis TaxID=555393 RepID=UPI00197AB732|nr:(2Fe-2S)-binding protein [Acholeplasma equirhinis]MBN3490264.1 (2Fe-2S)-binding protein [Acholeplasma equirhinis]